jgi:signal transduction histidine kinase/ligand-binding sensor domain-containing protein
MDDRFFTQYMSLESKSLRPSHAGPAKGPCGSLTRISNRYGTRGAFIWLIVSLFIGPIGSGQVQAESDNPYVRQAWTTENGLPQNSVTSILQTRDGYLWLGTLGGLARFDGVEFTVFNTVTTPQLKSNRIRTLYEDSEGSLWIGTEHGGLTRYRQGVFTNYSASDGLPSTSVLSIAGGAGGDLWVGTLDGLTRLHAGVFTQIRPETGLPHTAIEAICRDSHGHLWLGADGIGLIRYAAGTATTYAARTRLPGDVMAIREVNGTLWVGTRKGLTIVDEETLRAEKSHTVHIGEAVRSIYQGPRGIVWVATEQGLLRFENGVETRFTANDGLPNTNLHAVFVDREQNLWIGTDGGGLDRWRIANARAYIASQGLTDRPTMSILQNHDGVIWIGSLGDHSLYFYKDGNFSPYPHSPNSMESVASLAEDHMGNLWLGDWKFGLGYLDIKRGQLKHYRVPGLSSDVVRSLYVDTTGALWIGTDQTGLFRLKEGRFTNFRAGDGLPDNSVEFITEDRAHTLWFGTTSGIGRLKDGMFTSYHAPGLSLVRTIHEDDRGELWIGTYGYGLFRFKDGRFDQITTADGLIDNVASSILEDEHGNFWISGNRGICRARRADLDAFADRHLKAVRCISYGVSDGMIVGETNGGGEPNGLKARDGKLWFPTIKGVVEIDPEIMNTQPPPVAIEQVRLEGVPLAQGQPVRIPPGKRDLEIHYTALTLSRPEQVVFRYKLNGLDLGWVNAGTRRTAYYPHLPPGVYTFTVIADNGEGVWNERGQSLEIHVLPPFWRTWWFLTLISLALIGLATLAYRMRALQWQRAHAAQETFSRQLLASQEAERQRIAAELHDSLGQSLLIIKNRAVLALAAFPDPELAREQLEEISAGASQAVEEVREISYNLRPYQLDRFGLTKALKSLCMQASKSSGIQILADVDTIDGIFSKDAESSIYRIVQEGVNNIIKHSQAGEAALMLRHADGTLHLRLHDNGHGFRPAAEANSDEAGPAGFGLIGIAERVRMLHGTYDVDSSASQGTTITIQIPVPESGHVS